jgi:hypothetical protein
MKNIKWYYVILVILLFFLLFEVVNFVYDKKTGKKLGQFVKQTFGDASLTPAQEQEQNSHLILNVPSSQITYIDNKGFEYMTLKSYINIKKGLKFRFK